MRVYINVTQEDIDNGEKCGGDTCPIALAVTRRLGDNNWSVGAAEWGSPLVPGATSMPLSRRAADFVSDFDCGREVKPFRFVANVPKWAVTR